MRQHRPVLLLTAAALIGGCAGVTPLIEDDPVRIMAEAPPPPPPEPEPEPEPEPVVEVTREAVEVHQSIHFAWDSDVIQEDSFLLMDEIANVLKEHNELRQIRIEGHTDNTGSEEHNMDLSRRRAASVMAALTERGVEQSRLSSEGYGWNRPRDTNDTDEGRAQNRRVEFVIVEREGEFVEETPAAEEPAAEEPAAEEPAAEEPAAEESAAEWDESAEEAANE